MKCKVDGCYARSFCKNLCRAHYYVWLDQLPTTRPGKRERGLRATPAAFRKQSELPYIGPCRCESPRPEFIGGFGCYQCGACGMPLAVST